MGATRESSSLTDAVELEELRRRAYGPEADIGNDPAAIARLIELEAGTPFGRAPVATETRCIPLPATDTAEPPRNPESRHRSRRTAMIAATALLLAVVGSILSAGPSEVTLYPQREIPAFAASQLTAVGQLGYLGIAPADVRLYDQYRGLNVWSALRGSRTTCLFVTSMTPPRWRVDCTPRDGEPTIDLLQYRESSRLAGFEALSDVPQGHVLRLTLQGGAVAVRIVEAPSTTVTDR